MEERITISLLLDFYGGLLTNRQQQCYALHYEEDMSLAEIAEELGVSRQAVHDNMQRALLVMEDYESKLHLIRDYEHRRKAAEEIYRELDQVEINKHSIIQLVAQMEG